MSDAAFIAELEQIIRQRLSSKDADSYTATLARSGLKRVAQKLGEEAVELALASVAGDRDEVLDESADLVYHLLVLLHLQDLSLDDVGHRLRERHTARRPGGR
ncbi:MAG TPA: phosphoribosyl-ATP diphosphatase [Woeseiaceae bacterium]|nr:phosphoribosyl-ATP diphosphatase [Woeseiaceae bacterium]